jgi:hypothetical protein
VLSILCLVSTIAFEELFSLETDNCIKAFYLPCHMVFLGIGKINTFISLSSNLNSMWNLRTIIYYYVKQPLAVDIYLLVAEYFSINSLPRPYKLQLELQNDNTGITTELGESPSLVLR